MKTLSLIPIILIALWACACASKNTEALKPAICNDTLVSFSNKVNPIIQQNCTRCHKAGGTSPNLEGYTNVQARQSSIFNSIKGQNGFTRMPPSGSLTTCEINQISNWVQEGAKNN